MAPRPLSIPFFANTQLGLLSAELAAETASTTALLTTTSPRSLSLAGLAILNLVITAQRTGLGGKTVWDLTKDTAVGGKEEGVGEHGIRVGDIVGLREQGAGTGKKVKKGVEEKEVRGVVTKVTQGMVAVALDKEGEEGDGLSAGRVWLVKLANDVTYKRMNQTMERLQKLEEKDQSQFVRVMFGLSSPTPLPACLDDQLRAIEWLTPNLNGSQKEAIAFALASREIALIHGPPGTGKTHTLVELILQFLKQGLRLLVCGPSNISVDNIVERLAPHIVPMVRLGHPARLLPSVVNHSLDVLTKTSDAAALVQDVRKEMDEKQASIRKTRNGRERKVIYGELKGLRKEYREREHGCVDGLVQSSKVVLATLHGAGSFQLRHAPPFDVVIIDEASQALEAQCWVSLLSAKKAILAGDHLQLPPTIKSRNSKTAKISNDKVDRESTAGIDKNMTLETTLFDRLLTLHGESIKRMLTTQYRMHELIMKFPSEELYNSRLVAAESVKTRLLSDLPGVSETEDTTEPVIFFDTQGGDFPEKAEDDDVKQVGRSISESKSNEMEVALVAMHVRKLVDAGVQAEDIAVITPYNAQLSLLSRVLRESYADIELGTVDGFQGREKEAVVFSLVRSNSEHESAVGFLAEKRRLNGEIPPQPDEYYMPSKVYTISAAHEMQAAFEQQQPAGAARHSRRGRARSARRY